MPEVAAASSATAIARSRIRLFGVLLAATLISMTLPLPWRLAAIGFAVAGLVAGIRTLLALSKVPPREGELTRGPGGHIVVAVLLGVQAIMLVFVLSEAVLYPVVADRDRCLAGASTQTARDACESATQDRMERLQERIREMGQPK